MDTITEITTFIECTESWHMYATKCCTWTENATEICASVVNGTGNNLMFKVTSSKIRAAGTGSTCLAFESREGRQTNPCTVWVVCRAKWPPTRVPDQVQA